MRIVPARRLGQTPLAIERRTRGDQRSTVLMASESHERAMRLWRPCRRPPPRPPPGDDTLAPQDFGDRRGAPAGVATSYRWPATWLLHYAPGGVATAERFHAADEWSSAARKTLCGRPCVSVPEARGRPLHAMPAGAIAGVRCLRFSTEILSPRIPSML